MASNDQIPSAAADGHPQSSENSGFVTQDMMVSAFEVEPIKRSLYSAVDLVCSGNLLQTYSGISHSTSKVTDTHILIQRNSKLYQNGGGLYTTKIED